MTIKILLILIYPDQITSLVGFEQENDAEQKKTVIIDANLIQKVTRPDKSDHWESKNVQTREEMQVWGERAKESLRKKEEEMKKRKCFRKGGANMVEDEEWLWREGCDYLKWKINGRAVMQNVNTLLKHVAMEKGIKLYFPHICDTKAEILIVETFFLFGDFSIILCFAISWDIKLNVLSWGG